MEMAPTFRQLCAIIGRCYDAQPSQPITDLIDVARTVLAKQKLTVNTGQFNRAIDAVLKARESKTTPDRDFSEPKGAA